LTETDRQTKSQTDTTENNATLAAQVVKSVSVIGFDCFSSKLHSVVSGFYGYGNRNKKLSYGWETVRRESMPRIAEMDVEMTT